MSSNQHLASKIQANDIDTQRLTAGNTLMTNITTGSALINNLTTNGGNIKADRIQVGATTGSIINGMFVGKFTINEDVAFTAGSLLFHPNSPQSGRLIRSFVRGYTVNLPTGFTNNNNYSVFISQSDTVTPQGVPEVTSHERFVQTFYVWDKASTSFEIDRHTFGTYDPAFANQEITQAYNCEVSYLVIKTDNLG